MVAEARANFGPALVFRSNACAAAFVESPAPTVPIACVFVQYDDLPGPVDGAARADDP
jgi:hypothetical protein